MPRDILIDPQRIGSGNPNIQFSGSAGNTLRLEVLSEGSVQFVGVSGSLLKISDFPAAGGALNSLFLSGTTAVTGSILPGVTGLYDLGSSGNRWANVYANSLSGSLTRLNDGSSYLIAGSNVTIFTGSSGAVTISAPNLAPSTSAFVTIGNDSSLTAERSLTAGTGLSLTDGGANSTVTLGINDSVVATVSGTRFTGQITSAVDIVASGTLKSLNSSGDEGGEIFLSKSVTNTSLNTGVSIDVHQNRVRIFETGGTNRGGYWDVTSLGAGVATNFLASSATPGGSDTHVQFNDGGSFGGDADFTFTKATNLLKVTNISGSLTSSNVSAGQVVVAGTGGVLSGNNNFWWDNTNTRVGIGTNAPLALLHVGAGNDTPTVSATAYVTALGTTNLAIRDATNNVELLNYAFSGGGLIGTVTSHTLGIRTANVTALTIDTSQNAGIGSTTPSVTGIDTGVTRLFVVAPNSNTGMAATFIADSSGRGILVADQGKTNSFAVSLGSSLATIGTNTSGTVLALSVAATERMRIDTSGNVGIGTNAMGDKLAVNGSMSVTGSLLPGTDNLYSLGSSSKRWNNVYATSISGSLTGSNVSAGQVVVAGTGGVLSGSNNFWWDNTNGSVGIGTTTPDTTITNTRFHIYNGIAAFNATYGIGWIGQSGPTNGTRTSSTIDQYDYGTWNPVFTGASGGNAGTMDTTNQKAYYVRVGKLCIATCYAKQTARAGTPATGNFVITGLPYASTGVGAAAVGRWISFTNSYYSMSGYVADTETQIRMYGQTGVGTSSSVISYADVPANAEIYLTITYRVA
jgi:hypothetical protein